MLFIPKKTSTDLKQNLLPGNIVVDKLLISLYTVCVRLYFLLNFYGALFLHVNMHLGKCKTLVQTISRSIF